MTTVLIADDHRMYNDGLKHTLSSFFNVVSQVFHGREVIPEVVKNSPHLVFLDINLPGVNGLDIGRIIKSDFPDIKILFLSMYNEDAFVKSARELGANAYLLKESSGEEILGAVHDVLNDRLVFPSRIENNLHHQDYFLKNFSLSKRELEVIKLIRKGYSTEEIAKEINLSFETVKSHRKNIFLKLNINKVSELVLFAVSNGI